MTYLGHPTIAEEADLLSAKDQEVSQLVQAFRDLSATWPARDGKAFAEWVADWGAFWQRWTAARNGAKLEIVASKVNPMPSDRILAGGYERLLRALTRVPGQVQRGDFQDLYARLVRAGGVVPKSGTPAPTAHDVDLDLFNASSRAERAVEHVPIVGPLVGRAMQDAGLGRGPGQGPDDSQVSKAKWSVVAVVAGVVGAVLIFLRIER